MAADQGLPYRFTSFSLTLNQNVNLIQDLLRVAIGLVHFEEVFWLPNTWPDSLYRICHLSLVIEQLFDKKSEMFIRQLNLAV